jgi:cell division protein FtsL
MEKKEKRNKTATCKKFSSFTTINKMLFLTTSLAQHVVCIVGCS